eukprot:3793110-Pyramimonas_sp.AAC.1
MERSVRSVVADTTEHEVRERARRVQRSAGKLGGWAAGPCCTESLNRNIPHPSTNRSPSI